ncbi:hypothetical protein L2C91_07280 [Rosenbergiella epipactidis]|uniref:hypothetical protein n=1 Tax=Rosenbergiella epipactidis TaxID=1544694 RepID=UPI002026BC90|nr:hypothetical protein [Rosenbergiella epipactidis]MCL9668175.1 hypothetical protein [Rosenbergiella epipactidis]
MSKNRALLVGIVVSVCTLIAGCAKQQPGGFTEIDHDKLAHTYQFRYQSHKLDHAALNAYITQRCAQQGFDKVDPLPEEAGSLPGYTTRWFQCNYKIKN